MLHKLVSVANQNVGGSYYNIDIRNGSWVPKTTTTKEKKQMAAKKSALKPVMPKSAFAAPKTNARIARRNASSVVVGNAKGAKLGRKR